jgi:two-component system cell cycle sensor histidine kinase/response regulator CckA
VLLAEDEEAVRAMTRLILEMHGYTVMEAASGEEALRVAEQYRDTLHLLVTDVVMPGLGGRKVAEQLQVLHPETKVLFLSGYTDDAVIRHGILHEQVNFLQKPFSPLVLANKVRAVLDGA